MKVEFFHVDGLRTRCLFAGKVDAPPLLLLHGYGASADSFVRNIDVLGQDFYVVAPDMAGFGFSEGSVLGGQSLPVFLSRRLEALLRHLDISPVTVCGHSFGGSIAVMASLGLHPKPQNLIIVCSGSALNPDEELLASLTGLRSRVPQSGGHLDLESFRAHMGRICVDPTTLPEEIVYTRWLSASLPGASQFFVAGLESLMDLCSWSEHRVVNRFEDITGRVLIICGQQDPSVPVRNAELAHRRIADSKLVVFDHCGHSPPFEQAHKFNTVVREFLIDDLAGAL